MLDEVIIERLRGGTEAQGGLGAHNLRILLACWRLLGKVLARSYVQSETLTAEVARKWRGEGRKGKQSK